MPQGNCVKHINLNKTLYRADECPHCKIILLNSRIGEIETALQSIYKNHSVCCEAWGIAKEALQI